MGLDTTHDCWHGPYSSFNRFRDALTEAAGLEVDWYEYPWFNYRGMWEKTPEEPLLVLLVHSDCDGYIFPDNMDALIRRLEGLLPLLSDEGPSFVPTDRKNAQQFIDGLKEAWSNWEIVRFH